MTSGFSEDGLLLGALPYHSAARQMTLSFLSQQLPPPPPPVSLASSQSYACRGHLPQCPLEAWPHSAACLPADIFPPTEEGQDTEVRAPISFSLPQMLVPGHLGLLPAPKTVFSP